MGSTVLWHNQNAAVDFVTDLILDSNKKPSPKYIVKGKVEITGDHAAFIVVKVGHET